MIPDRHNETEAELLDLVTQLNVQRCIIGEPPTLKELLDPAEEREIRECLIGVGGGKWRSHQASKDERQH